MNIYLVARTGEMTYDEQRAVVVIAPDEDGARTVAADHAGDECESAWFLSSSSAVTLLGVANRVTTTGLPRLVCRDFWES